MKYGILLLIIGCAGEIEPSKSIENHRVCNLNVFDKVTITSLDSPTDTPFEGAVYEFVPKCCATWDSKCSDNVLMLTCRQYTEVWTVTETTEDGYDVTLDAVGPLNTMTQNLHVNTKYE